MFRFLSKFSIFKTLFIKYASVLTHHFIKSEYFDTTTLKQHCAIFQRFRSSISLFQAANPTSKYQKCSSAMSTWMILHIVMSWNSYVNRHNHKWIMIYIVNVGVILDKMFLAITLSFLLSTVSPKSIKSSKTPHNYYHEGIVKFYFQKNHPIGF